MQEKSKKILYGRLVFAENDIDHFSRLYTPYNTFTVNSEDFSKDTINLYDTEVPLFSKHDVKKGNIIGAIFKEDLNSIQKALKECHPVSDEEDKKYSPNKQQTLFSDEEMKEKVSKTPLAFSPYKTFSKSYSYTLKNKDKFNGNILSFEKIYTYNSISYESDYIETITAEYDDEDESLNITLKTEDPNLIAMALADVLSIQRKNIKVIPLPYNSHFDEYFISMVKGAIIAAKAAEKYGEVIKMLIRPRSISPSFKIRRKTYVAEDYSRILREDISVEGDLGNLPILQDDIADTLTSGLIPSYAPEKVNINVTFHEGPCECTLFFSSYFKAISSASTSEHTYALAFSMTKQPISLILDHLEDELTEEAKRLSIYNQGSVKKHFENLLESEDAYVQSAIFSVNSRKTASFMSPISAINKAQSVALCFIQNGLTKQFERKYNFSFMTNREDEKNVKFFLGTPTSDVNKERIELFANGIELNEKKVDVGFLPRAYRGRVFTAGPDILSRHTSVILNKVKEVYEDETDTATTMYHQFYQGTRNGQYGTIIWGMGVLSGYRDFVSNEVVVTKAHFVLPHSSSFDDNDDVIHYKHKIMNILSLFNIRFRDEFNYSDSMQIDFVKREPIFDSLECLFPLVLSAYRVLLYELSNEKKRVEFKKVIIGTAEDKVEREQ